MADIDIDPFGDHESRTEEPMGEDIPLIPGKGVPAWDPGHEQETSFGGRTKERENFKWVKVNELYDKLFERLEDIPKRFHRDEFIVKGGHLYHMDKDDALMKKNGDLRSVNQIEKILGVNRLHDLGFDSSKDKRKKITARQAVILNKAEEKLPSASGLDKADDIDLQEFMESAAKSKEDLIAQFEGQEMLPMRDLVGLDKQLRNIRGLLRVEVTKRLIWKNTSRENRKLKRIREHPGEYDNGIREDIMKRIDKLNDELKIRQDSIDLLKGRLKSQITSFKEMIAKMLDKDTSLAEKIRTLFREQGIMIASMLTAIGMAIGVLIEALLPSGVGAVGGEPAPPKDEKGVKEWLRNKLKALASLLGRLGMKAAEALPGIIGAIISWVLNRAMDVVGWVS